MTDTVIDLRTDTERLDHLVQAVQEQAVIDATTDAIIGSLVRDTRIRLHPSCDDRGARWSGPVDADDNHKRICDCGTDCGRIDGAWYGFEIFPDGSMVCESCDDTVGF